MIKQRIHKLLPAAVAAIQRELSPQGQPIAKEYQGYISSFGASIMQMGLLPTLAVFAREFDAENNDRGATQDQRVLLNILHAVATCEPSGLRQSIKGHLNEGKYSDNSGPREFRLLFRAAIDLAKNEDKLRELKMSLLDAAVATKLAIRTFKLRENA